MKPGDLIRPEMLVEQQEHLELAGGQRRGDHVRDPRTPAPVLAHLLEEPPGHRARQRRFSVRGPTQELESIYAAADALLLPAFYEPSGVVALQALGHGLPIISSAFLGVSDLVLAYRAGIIISDLRGVLPWFQQHIPSIIDARKRLLARGGVLIPRRDILWAAVVEAHEARPALHDQVNGGHVFVLKHGHDGDTIVGHHHLAAIWDGDGQINNPADFEKYLQRWAKLLDHAPKVQISDRAESRK